MKFSYIDGEVVDLLAHQKELNFNPGDEFLYSNSGYFLLSIIVKKAAGKSLCEFAEENIFKPLAVRSTHFHNDHTMIVHVWNARMECGRALPYGMWSGFTN